jgi:hypothetical protein
MNDTSLIDRMDADGLLSGGQAVVFYGSGFVSATIEHLSPYLVDPGDVSIDAPSHIATILDRTIPVNGKPQAEPFIIESTTDLVNESGAKVSGPQVNALKWRIAHYDVGARVYILELRPELRAMLNWPGVWSTMLAKLGKDGYNKVELVEYVLRRIPVLDDLPWLFKPRPDKEVCSEYRAEGMRGGGWPGLVPALTTPAVFVSMAAWRSCTQVCGPPMAVKGYNTI